jgi:hypothetical protein
MGLFDQLSSATGDKASNLQLVEQCLKTPALLHTVAEGLRSGTPKVKSDCAWILLEAGKRSPDLLGSFVADLLDASAGRSKPVARQALAALALATPSSPAEVFARRDYLLELARAGGPRGLAAAGVLAALNGHNPTYRGKLLGRTLRLLDGVSDPDLPRWAAALATAVEGSPDGVKRMARALAARREGLPDAAIKKLDRLQRKLERVLARR